MAPKYLVIFCERQQRLNVARVELSRPLQVACGLFRASLPSLDETHHLKYPRVVGQSLPGDFQFGQGAIVIAVASIKMHRPREVRFARIRFQTKSRIDCALRHRQPRWRMVDLIEIKRVMSGGELAIRLEKRWVARD